MKLSRSVPSQSIENKNYGSQKQSGLSLIAIWCLVLTGFLVNAPANAAKPVPDTTSLTCTTAQYDTYLDGATGIKIFDPCETAYLVESVPYWGVRYVWTTHGGWSNAIAATFSYAMQTCMKSRDIQLADSWEVSSCYMVDAEKSDSGGIHPELFSRTPIPAYNRPLVRLVIYKNTITGPEASVFQWAWDSKDCTSDETRDPTTGNCVSTPKPEDEKDEGNGTETEPDDNLPDSPATTAANGIPDPCNKAEKEGNPCDPTNGNKYEVERDYVSPGTGIQFVRTYNSLSDQDVGLGFGWRSSANARLEIDPVDPSKVMYRRSDGRGEPFSCGNKGSCKPSADSLLSLVKSADGYVLTTPRSITEVFDVAGQLIQRTSLSGQSIRYTYDAIGKVSQVTGPFGHSLAFAYDQSGLLSSVILPDGLTIGYAYDVNRNLVRVDYPDGTFKLYHYEDSRFPHHLTGITNEKSVRYSTFAYDALGRANLTQHAETDNGGPQEKITIGYGSDTDRAIRDAEGNVKFLVINHNLGVRNLLQTRYPDGSVATQTVDSNNNVTSRTDEEGRVTTYTYNRSNQLTGMTEADGTAEARTTTYKYLSTDSSLPIEIKRASVKNRKYVVTSFEYDAQENLIAKTTNGYNASGNAITRSVRYAYNALGQVTSIDGPRTDVDDTTTLTYHNCTTGGACGKLASITSPMGLVTTFDRYDVNAQLLEKTDPSGLKVNYAYDNRGRVRTITETSPVGVSRITQYQYDATGNLATALYPDGLMLSYGYDAANYLRSVTDNLGNSVVYAYDIKGNLKSTLTSDPDGTLVRAINVTHDTRNRVELVNQGGTDIRYRWDGSGLLLEKDNQFTTRETHQYDALGRRSRSTYGGIQTNLFGYDDKDHLSQVTAANQASTSYTFDDLGNRESETGPDRGMVVYGYDAAGNVVSATDARGITAAFVYDADNRLISIDYPGVANDVRYQYDTCVYGKGRICTVSDSSGIREYVYDGFGNISDLRDTKAGQTYRTGYAYDGSNRVMTSVYPSGREVTYHRDPLGHITGIDSTLSGNPVAVVSGRTFRADGQLASQTLGNGLLETRGYEGHGWLSSLSVGAIYSRSYSYDQFGRISSVNGTDDYLSYSFDSIDRLTVDRYRVGGATSTTVDSFGYDQNGNRLSDSTGAYLYDSASNRMSSAPAGLVTLDAAGNLVTDAQGRTYLYNDAGRLVEIRSGAVLIGSYVYNSNGLRTVKMTGTGTVVFHYDLAGQLISETQPDGSVLKEYIWADGMPVAQIDRDSAGQEIITYFHTDHLSTPRMATNAAQQIVWRWNGAAFGRTAALEDPDQDGMPTVVNLRFPGQYYDSESALHYNWNRYYDPKTGRYITSDPIGLWGGLNTYEYSLNNPIIRSDPYGLWSWPSFGDISNYWGETFGTMGDFVDNYQEMREANTIGSDKYFHCKANCEAAQRGVAGYEMSELLSDTRELLDQKIKGDPESASKADQCANKYGRSIGYNNPEESCELLCAGFRPAGL